MEYCKLDNGWIAPPGDYQDMAKALCESDPRLNLPDKKRSIHGPVRAIVFEFTKTSSGHHLIPTIFHSAEHLRDHMQSVPGEKENAVYILESLNQSVIDVMGSHFGLHPSLFLEYFRLAQTPGWGKGHSSLLASTLGTRDHLLLNYRELFVLPDRAAGCHDSEIRCSRTGRDIDVTRIVGTFDYIGAVHRRVVFWKKPRDEGKGWDCLVICDPPIRGVKVSDRLLGREVELPVVPRAAGPHRDGYVDFLPGNIQMTTRRGPPRTCVADDLAFYISTHGSNLGMDSPDTVALLVKKIVASQYTQYFDYFRRNLRAVQRFTKQPSHLFRSDLSAVEETWIEIQTVERRLDKTILYLEEILLQIGASLDPPDPRSITSWEDVSADFRLLYHHFIYLRQSAERTNASITGLASIVGNRQAFREQQLSLHAAERSRGLTFIGLVFIPLAFVSSLFSMADPYGPGGEKFWLYFVISIPGGILVMASYYIFDLGYSADGSGWSVSNLVNSWKDKTATRARPDSGG